MPIEEIANLIFKVINTFQGSLPTTAELQEWRQLEIPNSLPGEESSNELENLEQIANDVEEIVTQFNGNTKASIKVLLEQMNDEQRNSYEEKAENALLAVNAKDYALHHRTEYGNKAAQGN